ncbi:MAG TPA: hypothetical protein PK971_07665 [Saprospiraceae bacterium]|nr:hypothetical protein [Saprospiraceae bacterium]
MLKQHILYICWLLLALCWGGCQKADLPPSGEEPPVFSTPSPAGAALTAGVGGIYLYTDARRGSDGVITCSGTFEPAGCSPAGACAGGMRFEIRNLNTGTEVLPAEALRIGEYEYALADSIQASQQYRLMLSMEPSNHWAAATWTLNSTDSLKGATAMWEINSPEDVEIRLRATSILNGSTSIATRRISLKNPNVQYPRVGIEVNSDTFPKHRWKAIVASNPAVTYKWSNGKEAASFIDTLNASSYGVTVTDDFGHTASAWLLGYSGQAGIFSTPDVSSHVEVISTFDTLRLGKVALQWVDEAGRVWRSDRRPQPADSYFEVSGSEDYETNEKGQRTRKMSADFRCRLYTEAGEQRDLQGSSVFAVAY